MHHRDCPTVEVEERFTADAGAVWALVTDIGLPARFSSELQGAEWFDGATGPTVGARFQGHNVNPFMGDWTTVCVVVEVEPERRWVWEVTSDQGPMATWGFEVDPDGDQVRLRQWARLGAAPSGITRLIATAPEKEARIVASRLRGWRRDIEANLAGIRQLAEAPAAP